MSEAVRNLEPKSLWNHFADLNAVPRPSKKEQKVIAFIKDFGEQLGLPTKVDSIGNVIISKPATPGMEDRTPIVLQSHLDMVHQKNANVDFDFSTEGIKMLVEDDWVKADGTTLGADNGIGVATIMSLLVSEDIPHPPFEALFTIDEETGMTGALGLEGGMLNGKILLNLDTEDDDELTIGCAGGVDVTARGTYQFETIMGPHEYYRVSVTGLSGGHSGMEIHKGFGNANKIMNRILAFACKKFDIQVSFIDGGGLRNAIPRESFSEIAFPKEDYKAFKKLLKPHLINIKAEHSFTDPNLKITFEKIDKFGVSIRRKDLKRILRAIYVCPNGIYRMTPEIPDLVQSSNNLARVLVRDGVYEILCLTRSSVDSEKMNLAATINAAFKLIKADVTFSGSYPGWAPKPGAEIVKIMADLYQKNHAGNMHVAACHAGLECGIIGNNYPDMEMVSFGPNIRGAHSPDEKVQISSVQKYWKYLLDVLINIPVKAT